MLESTEITRVLNYDQEQIIEVMQSHLTLQDQFKQLTHHVEQCYARIQQLEKVVAAKVLA